MSPLPPAPPEMSNLRSQMRRARSQGHAATASFVRQTYRLPREAARLKAREWFSHYPKAAYWTAVESWRRMDGDEIEFTMRRLPSAD